MHTEYNTTTHFAINPVSKSLNCTTGKLAVVQHNHNVDLVTFEMPRFIDGHDMSLSNKVQIHFDNMDMFIEVSRDVYTATDFQISQDNEELLTFSWLISKAATKYAGCLSFSVRLACIDEDGTILHDWNTKEYTSGYVSVSNNNTEAVVQEYSDALESVKNDIMKDIGEVSIPDESITSRKLANGSVTEQKLDPAFVQELKDSVSSGEDGADGQDGITPHIGENGNWFLGETDTGKPSRGEQGITGANGNDYVLTTEDKQEIADIVAEEIINPLETLIDESGVLSE